MTYLIHDTHDPMCFPLKWIDRRNQRNALSWKMCSWGILIFSFSDDELIYLDPHTTQQAVDTESGSAVDDQSYHCQRTPHRMKITSLDPSVALVRAQTTSLPKREVNSSETQLSVNTSMRTESWIRQLDSSASVHKNTQNYVNDRFWPVIS